MPQKYTTFDIPYGYCHCGCGQKTNLARQNLKSKGWIRGEPLRFLPGHNMLVYRLPESLNPSGLCMCGCGQKTEIAKLSRTDRGWVKGQPKCFIKGHENANNSPQKAFWAYVTPGAPDECWLWQAKLEKTGYGRARYQGKKYGAHQLSWILHNGPIPKGLFVCHKCDVPSCVNPNHLFLGTPKDNTEDMTAKQRHAGRFQKGHPYYKKRT